MKIVRIFEYSAYFHSLTHSWTNVWIYSYKQIWPERMSEYIRTNKIDPNECPNKYSCPIYSNIRIFKYIRHTLVWNAFIKADVKMSNRWSLKLPRFSVVLRSNRLNSIWYGQLCMKCLLYWNMTQDDQLVLSVRA